MDTRWPRLSWELASTERSQIQTAYRIVVSDDEDDAARGIGQHWDTGKVHSSDTFHICYQGKPLASGRRYYWKVWSWNQADRRSEDGEVAYFETGLLDPEDWTAKWIGAQKDISAPLFRKAFSIEKKVRKATVYISGLGYYELYLNGTRVGDQVLAPAWSDYDNRNITGLLYPFEDRTTKRVHYITHNVTDLLIQGNNAICVMLGNGFYNQSERTIEGNMSYGSPKLIFQLIIAYEDGARESVLSDESWKISAGPILFNNVFYGEVYDARLEQTGWACSGFDDSGWNQALPVRPPAGRLISQLCPVDKAISVLHPKSITHVKEDVYVFDFGQNFSGWVRIRAEGPAGTPITLRFAEECGEDGQLDVTSCGGEDQVQTDVYVMKGSGGIEQYEPRFTWHGFRYVEVSGFPGKPNLNDLEGIIVHAAVEETGHFECSEPLFNQVQHLYRWSQLSNLHGGVPSDCPHRERLGYTGDGHLTAEAAMFNFDMASFYTKWIEDIRDAQNRDTGFVPHTVPFNGGGGGVAWGCAYVIMPWLMFRTYGDKGLLEAHYEGMKRWLAYLATRNDHGEHLVLFEEPGSWFLGDWCVPGENELPPVLVSSFYYAYVTRIMSQIANVLGNDEDRDLFTEQFGRICSAINKQFLDEDKLIYSIGRQGADVFPFILDCVPPALDKEIWSRFLNHHRNNTSGRLDTGIFGTAFLFELLSERGEMALAVDIFLSKGYPGYSYMIEKGATTLWEYWDGAGSHNHPMFGSVSAWFYKYIAGIRNHPDAVAFGRAVLKPFAVNRLSYASASVHTIRGKYAMHWCRKNAAKLRLEITIPSNGSADLYIPLHDVGGALREIREEQWGLIWQQDDQRDPPLYHYEYEYEAECGHLIFKISSGFYLFQLEFA